MPRGGHREKSGRKSTWKSGCKFVDTKLIRVPASLAEQLLEIAHRLDAESVVKNDESVEFETGQLTLLPGKAEKLSPMSGPQLIKRLGLSSTGTLGKAKKRYLSNLEGFHQWSKERDPQNVAWEYEEVTKKFYPLL